MGIIFGIICLICFCVLLVKAITRKYHLEKADRVLMRFHKGIGRMFVVVCVMHIVFVAPVLKNRSIFVNVTGFAGALFMLLLICLCSMIKDKNRSLCCHRVLSFIMVICVISHIAAYIVDFKDYQQKVSNIAFDDIEMANIKDGVYEGEYDAGYIYAKVEVEIRNGEIVSVHLLEHRNERGKAAESILNDVVDKQKIDVDTVSGATNSSNVIKKAVEMAITGNEK